jgi:transcriptional regulator with AAA-type ATPase domain/tetratricopeptide (TPR) repeat protein
MGVLDDLSGHSPGIRAVREQVSRLLGRRQEGRRLPPILIQGETGTGKGLLARLLHRAGPRADGPFVDVNCAAIPETLLEAEMFGFERGAFTDARRPKPGLFQTAHRGTIFLDEVGLLPEALQAKLLKAIEERAVRRLGSTRDEPVDVWVLTATNEDLRAAIAGRRFREDLYHRLAVVTLVLPPLRERGEDVLFLAEKFLARTCDDYGVTPRELTPDARAALLAYAWPGNVRELANVIERAVLLSSEGDVTAAALALSGPPAPPPPVMPPTAGPAAGTSLDDAMREHLVEVLTRTDWNISRSAALLGIARNTLRARIEKYGLRPGARTAPRREERRGPATTSSARRPAPSPGPLAAPAPVTGALRWEERPVALLRMVVTPTPEADAPLETSRALELALDKIRTFGGQVESMSPTSVTVAFGLEPTEEAPSHAALAAMAIQKAMVRAREDGEARLTTRIGIHVGRFMVGQGAGGPRLAEDARRRAADALDDLADVAAPDSTVVSADAAAALERRFELVPVPVEGPRRVFAVVGYEARRFAPSQRLVTFVGRRRELELLWGRLESALRGQGQIVGITGEAGIGKSRLLHEFRRSLESRPITYREGQCLPYGRAIPFFPLLDMLRTALGIDDRDRPDAVRAKVHGFLAALGMDGVAHGPFLLHLLGVEEPGARLATLEPNTVKARIFETQRELVLRQSRQQPLVLVVEDLHWADETSAEYLAALADVVGGARILLVTTSRPGHRPPWSDRSNATLIGIQPLAPEDSLSVVRAVFGDIPLAEDTACLILDRAEGNPFFLEELARALREADGDPRVTAVPATVQDVLQARLDRLPAEDRRLLQCAAVVGKDVPVALLEAIAGRPAPAVREGLAALARAEFLYETRAGAEAEYSFKHALTHEVAYASLPADDRRAYHARIAAALEDLYAGRQAEHLEQLGHHAFHGGAWAKAVRYLRQAGERAALRSADREAVACFEQALAALAQLPESRETLTEAIDLRLALRTSLLPLGELARLLDHARAAERIATALGDQRRLGQLYTYLTNYYFMTGDQPQALEYGERALATAEALDDFALRVEANLRLGQVCYSLGEYRRAADVLQRTVDSLTGDLEYERFGLPLLFSVGSRNWLIRSLAELGRFEEGLARGAEAVRIAEAADHPFSLTVAYWGLGHLHLLRGDLDEAITILERGLAIGRTWHLLLWLPRIASALGLALALSGRVEAALPLLEDAVARSESMRTLGDHAARVAMLGEGVLLAGRVGEARALAERAIALARAHGERGYAAWARRLLGEVDAREAGRAAHAETAYREALEAAEALEMRPLTAHCHLGLGRLQARAGRRAEALDHLARAHGLYAEMGMRRWLDESTPDGTDLG